MAKLVYHKEISNKNSISPFDLTITEIVSNQKIKIVCPYLSIEYLKYIINISIDWKLLSDIDEWLISNSPKKRREIRNFIENHRNKIHHFPDLHAKVILTDKNIFLGSANFTKKGLTGRNEVSVVIDENDKVKELNQWFDNCWKESEEPLIRDIDMIMNSNFLNDSKNTSDKKISSKIKQIKTSLIYQKATNSSAKTPQVITNLDVVKRLRKWNDRNWSNSYFDLIREVIDSTNLEDNDERIVISMPKDNRIGVSIGQRLVLSSSIEKREVALILPLEYDMKNAVVDNVSLEYRKLSERNGFFRNKERDAYWLHFDTKNIIVLPEHIKEMWKKAIEKELKRTKKSSYKKFHSSILYNLALDIEYRDKIFSQAYNK